MATTQPISGASPTDLSDASRPRWRRGLGRAGPIAIIATAVPIAGNCAILIAAPFLADWLRAQGTLGVIYFTAAFALLGMLMLAPTYTVSVIAGWTFGFAVGFPAVVIGTVSGSILCYGAARWAVGRRVAEAFADHPKWELVRRALTEENALKTLWIVFLLRLSPVLPFGTTNVLLATTGVRFSIFVVGTLLGLVPRISLVSLAAAGAESLDLSAGRSWWMLAAGIAATVMCIIVLAVIGKRALRRATENA